MRICTPLPPLPKVYLKQSQNDATPSLSPSHDESGLDEYSKVDMRSPGWLTILKLTCCA